MPVALRLTVFASAWLAAGFALAGCGGSRDDPAPIAATTSTSVSSTTSVLSTSASIESTSTTSTEGLDRTSVSNDDDRPDCVRWTDFASDAENGRWEIANDNVMGGRSLGDLSFVDETLIFEGEINTNGGGFASVRVPLTPDLLAAHDRVVLRLRPDDRSYTLDLDDSLDSRDRRVSHWGPIGTGAPGEWQTVSVSFDDLAPTLFGRRVDDVPFRNDLASGLRLIISDGIDGPFRLEVDWIEFCPG